MRSRGVSPGVGKSRAAKVVLQCANPGNEERSEDCQRMCRAVYNCRRNVKRTGQLLAHPGQQRLLPLAQASLNTHTTGTQRSRRQSVGLISRTQAWRCTLPRRLVDTAARGFRLDLNTVLGAITSRSARLRLPVVLTHPSLEQNEHSCPSHSTAIAAQCSG